jgi:hypothetical protein
MSAILARQAFATDIAQSLWPANEFLSNAKDDTQWVDHDKVNLPHAGTAPTVVKNRTTKGTAVKRVDAATQYALHELSSDPTWIQFSEELITNYNKRASVLDEHKNALIEAVADNAAFEWAFGGDAGTTSPLQVRTSNTLVRPVGLTQIGATAPTGNRKRVSFDDMLAVLTLLNKQNVPLAGRFALITADMLSDLLLIPEFKNSDFVINKPVVDAPQSFTWLGMKFYVRSKVNAFTNAATPVLKAVGAASAATDNAGAIFWHKDMVRVAKGAVKVFLNLDDAELYGDKMSALVRFGAIAARKDNKGIVNLVESAG